MVVKDLFVPATAAEAMGLNRLQRLGAVAMEIQYVLRFQVSPFVSHARIYTRGSVAVTFEPQSTVAQGGGKGYVSTW
jgi:hypothetical protein